mmetsp:Transcript_45384/g.127798  ORF Transcript_45384/g.127798 Transcript_45384/m.127798 type:complete len:87 (-) Transcript_45384:85-345(-)
MTRKMKTEEVAPLYWRIRLLKRKKDPLTKWKPKKIFPKEWLLKSLIQSRNPVLHKRAKIQMTPRSRQKKKLNVRLFSSHSSSWTMW